MHRWPVQYNAVGHRQMFITKDKSEDNLDTPLYTRHSRTTGSLLVKDLDRICASMYLSSMWLLQAETKSRLDF